MTPWTDHERRTYTRALGLQLRTVRRLKGMNLIDVQRATGGDIDRQALGTWETGRRAINVDRLIQLAGIYGVPVADLLPGEWAMRRVA